MDHMILMNRRKIFHQGNDATVLGSYSQQIQFFFFSSKKNFLISLNRMLKPHSVNDRQYSHGCVHFKSSGSP